MKKIIPISFCLLFIQLIAHSQVNQDWVSKYNSPGDGYDVSLSVAVDAAGNVFVCGGNLLANDSNFITIKYNSLGVQQWVNTYLSGGGYAKAITLDASGNVYVTGFTAGVGIYDCIIIKYNINGVQQWVHTYNGPGNGIDVGAAITTDASSNVYVASTSTGIGSDNDYAIIKYNSAGAQQWVTRYNGPGNAADNCKSIAVDGAGNVYVTGYSDGGSTDLDYATLKYNSSGVQQWIQRYNGTGNFKDYAVALAIDVSGNVYVSGYSTGAAMNFDYVTIKYNTAGVQQWLQRYDGPANQTDEATAIGVDANGNVYVTGYSVGTGSQLDYATIKYNSAGAQQWVQRYNGPGNSYDEAFALKLDASANVYVTGFSIGSSSGEDWATVKYDSSGAQKWVQRYNGTGNIDDEANAIALDGSGNVYITGYSGSVTSYDFTTIKYSQPIGIQQISTEVPRIYYLSQNYPNPFNPSTKFKFQVSQFSETKISIYDVQGREVEVLVDQQLQPGTYEAEWNAVNYSSGVYFYKLNSGDYSETKKMILTK